MSITRKLLAGAAIGALAVVGLAAQPAQAEAPSVKDVVLSIGADDSQRGLTWLSGSNVDDYVQIAQKVGHDGFRRATIVRPDQQGAAGEQAGWDYNKATLTNLRSHTTYDYRICVTDASCSTTYEFTTGDRGTFNFLVYGDPQVYTGTKTMTTPDGRTLTLNPSAGWATMLANSTRMFPHTAFLMPQGDQVDSYTVPKQVAEWDAFLAPSQVTSYPMAPNVGNHDNANGQGYLYGQHFNLPNLSSSYGVTASGTGDYWYTYGGVLFLELNTNNLDIAGHTAFMQQAITANPHSRWRILRFHQAPYSAADHPNDQDVIFLRQNLTPVLSQLGIDLVLNGHDHDYVRSYLMDGTSVVPNSGGHWVNAQPGQVLYIETNSASGGKFYDLTNTANNYYWAAVVNQDYTAQFTNVEVRGAALIVSTYTVDGQQIDQVVLTQLHRH